MSTIDKSRKCVAKKCKKEEEEYNKASRKIEIGSNPEDDYSRLLQSKESKKLNKCYETKCPNFIRDGIESQKITAISACETEKNKKWRNKMCEFASDIQKVLDKKVITGQDKMDLSLKFSKLVMS